MSLEKMYKEYCLHDCAIDKINIEENGLILYSKGGIYRCKNDNKDYKRIENCKIHIKIDYFSKEVSYEHISIYAFKKNNRKEISVKKLCKMVDSYGLNIYLVFYSLFANSLLIKGYCNKYEIELLISEINDILLVY